MRSRLLINLVLAVLVISLTAWLVLTVNNSSSPAAKYLSATDPREINSIEIFRAGRGRLSITKTGAGWLITEPSLFPASNFRINSMLSFLQSPVMTRFNVEPIRRSEYGLDPPRASLRMNNESFYFGDVNPLDGGRFVFHDETIYVVEDRLFQQLLQADEFFFNKHVGALAGELVGIQCGDLILQKAGNQWQLPDGAKIIPAPDIAAIGNAWSKLEASAIVPATDHASMGEIYLDYSTSEKIVRKVKMLDPELILSTESSAYDFRLEPAMAEILAIPPAGC